MVRHWTNGNVLFGISPILNCTCLFYTLPCSSGALSHSSQWPVVPISRDTVFNYSCQRHPSWLRKKAMSTAQETTKAAKIKLPSGSRNRKINSITNQVFSFWHSIIQYHAHFLERKIAQSLWSFQVWTRGEPQVTSTMGKGPRRSNCISDRSALLRRSAENLFFAQMTAAKMLHI